MTYKDINLKLGIKAPSLRPDIAILDGNIPMTLPYNIAAASTILIVARNGLNSEHGAKLVSISTLFSVITIPALTILINLL